VIRFNNGADFNVSTGEIARAGTVVRLEPQPAAVLATLAARPGELVTHDELRRAVWGETTHVKLHDALHYCVRQIRHALGDTARDPRVIETVPRRGYRVRAESLAPSAASFASPSPALRRWALRLAVAAALLVVLKALDRQPNNHHEIAVSVVKSLHDLVF
jgi:DNA-binding winged helix-turn-helix (wHTH) protein